MQREEEEGECDLLDWKGCASGCHGASSYFFTIFWCIFEGGEKRDKSIVRRSATQKKQASDSS